MENSVLYTFLCFFTFCRIRLKFIAFYADTVDGVLSAKEHKDMDIAKNAKKTVCIAAFCLLFLNGFAVDFFSVNTGAGTADIIPGDASKKTEVKFRAFYGTQIQAGKRFLANAGISLRSGNLFDTMEPRDIPSLFNIDELSFMYRFRMEQALSQIAFFMGEYEPLGDDVFARRYLGTRLFNSYFLQKRIGFPVPAIIPAEGIGGSFTVRYKNIAGALYTNYAEKNGKKHMNIDARIAGVSNALIVDFLFGVTLPFEDRDSNGEKVVAVIRTVDFHTGLTMLVGDNPFVNLYMQAGIARLRAKPAAGEKIFVLDDLYAFLEPRFSIQKVLFSLSLFHLPPHTYQNISYADYPLGASFMIKSVPLNLKSANWVFGGILSVSMPNPAVSPFSIKTMSIQAVPYFECGVGKGVFKAELPVRPLSYDDVGKLISLSISYKVTNF